MQHVAVLHYIFLALQAHLAGFLGAGFAIAGDIIIVTNGLGADKAFFEIGVDNARRLWRFGAARHGPSRLRDRLGRARSRGTGRLGRRGDPAGAGRRL